MDKPIKKLKLQLQTEIDASYLYGKLAQHYQEKTLHDIFQKMSVIERGHGEKVLKKIYLIDPHFKTPGPSLRARLQAKLGEIFGFEYVITNLAAVEWSISQTIINQKRQAGEEITGFENLHLNILQNLFQQKNRGMGGAMLSRFEGKHKTMGGNELRAAVLGANDGLVSNLSLVMGVAGATANQHEVLIAGIAGLLAGSISMALGEWLSVQSSRELYEKQIAIEEEELESSPEEELNELILLYQAKGLSEIEATKLAKNVFKDKAAALASLVKEELGYDLEITGISPGKAAVASFLLFAFGAVIPVLPFFFLHGKISIILSIILSLFALFAVGSVITLFTGKSVIFSGIRQVLFGLIAAAITFGMGTGIGLLIGLE